MLANILRPKTISDVIGQKHLLGDDKPIKKMCEKKNVKSMLLWGPAGTGKTTIARCIANDTGCMFKELNATSARIADARKLIEMAKKRKANGSTTVVYVDEVHRFPKNVQDVFLPVVETGEVVLIGSTVEKPVFAVNAALLSRMQEFELKQLGKKDMLEALLRVVKHYDHKFHMGESEILRLINRCGGDIRKLMTTMETIVDVLLEDDSNITSDMIDAVMPNNYFHFDKGGNEHFDLAAAWQNSIQNSDADQAIYFLAKWILSGESPIFIARRIMISASEDAPSNPNAAMIANNAYIAAREIGYPECKILFAHATIEIANSPRGKIACNAISKAMSDIESGYDVVDLGAMGAGKHSGYSKVINRKYVQ